MGNHWKTAMKKGKKVKKATAHLCIKKVLGGVFSTLVGGIRRSGEGELGSEKKKRR